MNDSKQMYAAIYRNCIAHHRNQIKFLCGMIREGSGHKATLLKLAKSHAVEIKETLNQWEMAYPRK